MSDRLLLDTCGCCDDELPQPTLANPPGQAALRYRMSVHGEFVARMVVQLSRQRFPLDNPDAPRPLHALTARAPDDFAIGLIDAWAVMGDVLTFYQERIVNEGFLRTATERRSVLELARTIGYELSPGVAAETLLVFTVDEADATPDTSEIAAGTQVQSIPREQDELPQTFETSEGLVAHVDWNAMRPRQTETQLVSSATTMLTFTGLGNNLQIGDRLLLIDPALEDAWEVRRITAVKTEPARNRTHVTVTAGSVNKLWRPAVYVFRQRANIFGHNAGEWTGLGKQVRADYWGVAVDDLAKNDTGQWPEYTICAPAGGTRKRSAKITARQVADAALQAAELQAKIMTRSTIAGAPEVLLAGGVALTALAGGLRTNLEAQTADVLAMVNIVPDADSTAATALAEIARGLTDIIGAISIETGSLPSFSVSPPTIDFSPDALVDTAENLTEYVTEVSEYLAEALPSIAAVLPKLLIDSPAVADALATIFTELQTLFRTLNPLQSVIDLVTGEQPELGNVAEQAGRLMQRATSAGAATMGFHGLQAVLESALLLDPSAEEVRQLALSTAGLAANAAGTASGDVESVSALASQYGGIGGFETMLESSFQPLLLMNTGVVDGVERVQAAVEAALDQYAIVVQDDDKDCTKIDLDGRYDKITPESWVYLLAGGEGELFDVVEVEETSRAEYQISLEVTRLTLARAALDSFEKKVRETKVYGAPEPLELAAIDIANAVQGTVIYLDRLVQLPPAGATLIVAGAPAAGVPAVDDSDAPEVREAVELKRATQQGGQTRLEFTPRVASRLSPRQRPYLRQRCEREPWRDGRRRSVGRRRRCTAASALHAAQAAANLCGCGHAQRQRQHPDRTRRWCGVDAAAVALRSGAGCAGLYRAHRRRRSVPHHLW